MATFLYYVGIKCVNLQEAPGTFPAFVNRDLSVSVGELVADSQSVIGEGLFIGGTVTTVIGRVDGARTRPVAGAAGRGCEQSS